MKTRMKMTTVIVIILMMIVTSGCSLLGDNSKQVLETFDDKKNSSIKVMYYDEQAFMMNYGNLFAAKYPNVDIEVVTTRSMYQEGQEQDPEKRYQKFIEEHNPDVLLLPVNELSKLAGEQLLYDLEPVIAQDKFDLENIHPKITEYLKMKGGGKLYGLTPNFSSEALFINRDLFEKHGVQLTDEPMTWESLLSYAQRFPKDGDEKTRIYGYANAEYQSDPYSIILMIGLASGLVMDNEGKAALQTPGWTNIFEMVTKAIKEGGIEKGSQPDYSSGPMMQEDWLMRNKFVAGRAAMTMANSYVIENLRQLADIKKDKTFNWEIVNAPRDADATQRTNFTLNEVFAINAKSTNQRAAWELVKYINSDEMARVRSKSSSYLWSRPAYMKLKNGTSLEPFYQLSFNSNETSDTNESEMLQYRIRDDANKEIEELLNDKKTLEQVLEVINTKAQEQLDQLKRQREMKDTEVKTEEKTETEKK